MIEHLAMDNVDADALRNSIDCEIEINNLRNDLREEEILRLDEEGAQYQNSVYYIDIIAEVERMGDYIINITEALHKVK